MAESSFDWFDGVCDCSEGVCVAMVETKKDTRAFLKARDQRTTIPFLHWKCERAGGNDAEGLLSTHAFLSQYTP